MNIKDIGKIAASAAVSSALLLGGSTLAFAQTTYTTTGATGSTVTPAAMTSTGTAGSSSTTGSTTPGVPNTGSGGEQAANLAILGVSALIAAGGAIYLARRKYA